MVNIVLDLDETLIHTVISEKPNNILARRSDLKFQFSPDGAIYYVFKRPGLDEFLNEVFKQFKKVGIWTAADRQYAKMVIKKILSYQQIMNLDFVFSRDYCVTDSLGTYKPLSKIYRTCSGWRPEETIILDNSTQALRDNPQNGIVAVDYAEPHLEGDIYLYLLTDILRESLPKTRIYQFVDRVNQVMPYVVSLYQMGDSTYRTQDLNETIKIHSGIVGNEMQVKKKSGTIENTTTTITGGSRNRQDNRTNKTLDLGLNAKKMNGKEGPTGRKGLPQNVKQTVSRRTMKVIQDPTQRKAMLLKQFK